MYRAYLDSPQINQLSVHHFDRKEKLVTVLLSKNKQQQALFA